MKRTPFKVDPNKTVRKTCKGCGEPFVTTASRQLGQTYCTPLCGIKAEKKARPSHSAAERKWQQAVREKDGCRCQVCGVYDPHIDTHHVASRKQRPDLKYDVSNGVCLCREHHAWAHNFPLQAKALGLVADEKYELARNHPRSS